MKAAVITVSTSGYNGVRTDKSGPAARALLEEAGFEIKLTKILPDDRKILATVMQKLADGQLVDLIVTTGGTGLAKDDVTPEATLDIVERQVPGIPEAMRVYSMNYTKRAMLSRAVAGIRKETLIINLPGSPSAVEECLEFILPEVVHGVKILTGAAKECASRRKK